ncbi:hypothetical protein [Thalassococcus sp. S3]|uniref:hypothetical protein n=1 Tax=Thalassococcus sp. S3 TaxID=2017482 RepID=UPI0013EED45A|nr:hypothetical protein [Thalassococcus sp. S3]
MTKTSVLTGRHAGGLTPPFGTIVANGFVLILLAVVWMFCWSNISARADTVEAQRLMFQFQKARMNKLVLHQPNLVTFLSGAGSGRLNADVTDNRGTLTFSSGVERRLWARMNGRWGEAGQRKDKYGFGAIGLHALVRPTLIVGGMIEADYLSQATAASDREGTGVMAGPYILVRSADHPLFFEGRFLHGKTSDTIRLSDDGTGQPETRRALAQLKMSGELRYGITTLLPSILWSYAKEDVLQPKQRSFPRLGSRLHQIKMGLDFRHTLREMNGAPFVLKGGGTFSSTSNHGYGSNVGVTANQRNDRGRLNLGISYLTQAGGTVVIDSFVNNLGAPAPRNYGVKAAFGIRF